MDDFYREYILDHYQNPHNYGIIENPDISYEDSNPLCGDKIRIDLKLDDSRVKEAKFSGCGCAISQASASILTEMIQNKSLEELRHLNKDDMIEALGIELGPVRLKCALLALKVLKAGVYGLKGWPDEEYGEI